MEQEQTLKPKRNALKTIIQLVIFVGLGVFFIWFSLRSLNRDDIQMIFKSMATIQNPFSWTMIGLAALMVLIADVIRAQRARLLLEPMNYKVRFPMAFYSVMVCYLANLALPRLGEVLRCSFLQRFEGVPFQKSLGTVVTERAVDVLCWLVILFVAIACNTSLLTNLIVDRETQMSVGMWLEQKGLSVIGNGFIYILMGLIALFFLLAYWTRNWWGKIPFCVKIKDFIVGIWQGIIAIKDLEHPWQFVILTLLLWITYFLGNYFCFFAIPYLNGIGPGAAFTVLAFSTIAFMISQGGLGSYPLFVAGILVLYGVQYTQGLAAGWIGWLMQTAVVLVVGFLSLILASFHQKNITASKENR
ncbi:MAG: flippase-like domain-containing protein [Bacteroidales bacterium]|nr:flippase-like domain-containing protein [Bacteroidales bacterium]